MPIRDATHDDVPQMVSLSDLKRTQYEKYSPIFWRKSLQAEAAQTPYFHELVDDAEMIVLVHERESVVDGFIMGRIMKAPAVYDPGGVVCMVDDYMVADPGGWASVGEQLRQALADHAQRRGAVLCVFVCGHLDEPKRKMLCQAGGHISSEWYVIPMKG